MVHARVCLGSRRHHNQQRLIGSRSNLGELPTVRHSSTTTILQILVYCTKVVTYARAHGRILFQRETLGTGERVAFRNERTAPNGVHQDAAGFTLTPRVKRLGS